MEARILLMNGSKVWESALRIIRKIAWNSKQDQ